jgi:hypothetical protein
MSVRYCQRSAESAVPDRSMAGLAKCIRTLSNQSLPLAYRGEPGTVTVPRCECCGQLASNALASGCSECALPQSARISGMYRDRTLLGHSRIAESAMIGGDAVRCNLIVTTVCIANVSNRKNIERATCGDRRNCRLDGCNKRKGRRSFPS